jgi:micrococcal nuclease
LLPRRLRPPATKLIAHFVLVAGAVTSLWLLAACVSAPISRSSTPESGGAPSQASVNQASVNQASVNQAPVNPSLVPPGLTAVVQRVVDGDTIIVRVQDKTETIRLLGIDTPEKAGGPRPAECFGAEASARLAELLPPHTQVLLSRDLESRDQYSRLLAFVHRSNDGLFINLAMLEDGFATPLFFAPNRLAEERFTVAGDAARREWVGFWPACGAADVVLDG